MAQPTATVSARVQSDAGDVIAFASAVLESEPGTVVAAGLSQEDGRLTFTSLAPGDYLLTISAPGHASLETDVLVGELSSEFDLGDLVLPRLADVEEEITVQAEAPRTAALESVVFRLGEQGAQSTGSLLDAMRTLPGVTVDQDGHVLLRGSEQVSILIDGKQSSLTGFGNQRGLDAVAAANVESIEIIHNPSARFDAAGSAGIINVIYKSEQQLGFSGDVGLTLGNGQFSRQRDDLPTDLGSYSNNTKVTPSFNLAHTTEKARSFLQGEVLLQDDLPNNEFTTRFYDDGRRVRSQVPENREQTHLILKTGLDREIGARRTLRIGAIYDFETHTDRAQVPFLETPLSGGSGEVLDRFWFWREEEDTGFANVSFDLEHRFAAPGHELRFNLQYTRGWEDESYFLNEVSRVREGTDMTRLDAEENTVPLSVDYVRPTRTGRLELGAKAQHRWIPITYTIDQGFRSVIYDGLGDVSDWEEDIYALYGNLVRETSRTTVEAGVRIEQTNVAYEIPEENIYYPGSDSYDYFEVFPNVRLAWRTSPRGRFTVAYNRRIDRPGEPELRIFPKYDDPELLKVGNPFLRPQFVNAFDLGYRHSGRGSSWSATAYHRDIKDSFLRVFAIDPSSVEYDIVNKIFENAGDSRQTGVELLWSWDATDRWSLSASANVYRNEIDAFETILLFPVARPFSLAQSEDDTWDLRLNQQFTLPGATSLQLSYIRYAERNVPQGVERARSSVDLSLKRPLAGERAELVFTVTDVFNDFAVQREIDGNGFTAIYQNFKETQVASLGVRYRLR